MNAAELARRIEARRLAMGGSAAWCEAIDRMLPPPQRLRPRDPDEAELLAEKGTPPELIGPVIDRDQLALIQRLLRKRFDDEQEANQWLWQRGHAGAGDRPPIALLLEGRLDDAIALVERASDQG